ncbi:hypothetical protein HMPREF0208_02084 [Citrobacter koseri]|nr:hypothetical protein [Citrobacter koseri]KWZ97094.1 hypothetical protein HMPREF3220_03458 [Citrobacter koseri]KXA00719.1 hypothetical protein HMPREF3207_03377 [Citrobacter koseri]KXB44129.1 hypothetical protein HMPREF0208_02084 [Citrobacter koseri]WOJ22772.1 hypothetical protein R1015_04725 [Citrobacter koseri]
MKKIFLCDFAAPARQKLAWLRYFMLDKNDAQQEMPKQRDP